MNIETLRKTCLQRQTELKALLADPSRFDEAIQLFLVQHAALHSGKVVPGLSYSLQDLILNGVSADQYRITPAGFEHSIAWLLWHAARCEDITMNLLVAGSAQILLQDDRINALGIQVRDTGNAMSPAEIDAFSCAIDIEALLEYHSAVGQRTQQIVQELAPPDLKRRPAPERLQLIWYQGALLEAAMPIYEYWSSRTVAGLLLMPATRHHLVHLNEALVIKRKLKG